VSRLPRISLSVCVSFVLVLCAAAAIGTETSGRTEYSYEVSGRVRLLLFWTKRQGVGAARLALESAPDGGRRIELLIGTDPQRAPRKLNRWGYVAETLRGGSGEAFGLMTASDEATLEEATKTLDEAGTGGHLFKAIRSSNDGTENRTEVVQLRTERDFTYRDLQALLHLLPPPGQSRRATVPAGTDYGFLAAITSLIHDSVSPCGDTRPIASLTRRYAYAGRLYSITLRQAKALDSFTADGRTFRSVIDGDFRVTNLSTHNTTDFRIIYGARDTLAETPISVVYRPRWWLELQLLLKE
jgi:hypothetical protein